MSRHNTGTDHNFVLSPKSIQVASVHVRTYIIIISLHVRIILILLQQYYVAEYLVMVPWQIFAHSGYGRLYVHYCASGAAPLPLGEKLQC